MDRDSWRLNVAWPCSGRTTVYVAAGTVCSGRIAVYVERETEFRERDREIDASAETRETPRERQRRESRSEV